MALHYDPTLADLSFEEWMERKKAAEKRRTHGAEAISDSGLYAAQHEIDRACFGGRFRHIPMYFIPADLAASHSEAVGLHGYGCIMIKKSYYKAHDIDESVINTLFHEMVHAYNDEKGIKDTDGDYHTEAFAEACKEHGGLCEYANAEDGYCIAKLAAENMSRVKASVARMKGGA